MCRLQEKTKRGGEPSLNESLGSLLTFLGFSLAFQGYPQSDIRLGFVRYTDYDQGSSATTRLNFTDNIIAFENFVASIIADGGGDGAEDVMSGLEAALSKQEWRNRSTKVQF